MHYGEGGLGEGKGVSSVADIDSSGDAVVRASSDNMAAKDDNSETCLSVAMAKVSLTAPGAQPTWGLPCRGLC